MSDRDVAVALRSGVPLVLVEAPAGCGKTYQGAQYAKDLLNGLTTGRLLILAHTHAACNVFAHRTHGLGSRVEIRTIDSLITQIAGAYHRALDLPADVTAWAYRNEGAGFDELAIRVEALLRRAPPIAMTLATRYPYVICDEHQDSSRAQHEIIMAIHKAGAHLRIFADPMQTIYGGAGERRDADRRWAELQAAADICTCLDTAHRWREAEELGDWILEARASLKAGREIDLRGDCPRGLTVFRADNKANRYGQYLLDRAERRPIDTFIRKAQQLFVLTSTNDLVRGLNACFFRSLPIWEGHTRDAVWQLARRCKTHAGSPTGIAEAFITFVQAVATGFSNSQYADILRREVAEQCTSRRSQKPAKIQEIGRLLIDAPDHHGVAGALEQLKNFVRNDEVFGDVKLDLWREYNEAVRLGRYDDPEKGLTEIALHRTAARAEPPPRVISTVHKAKGLEAENVLLLPCDGSQFTNTDAKRRLLYVALSRATRSLALVIPNDYPSSLFRM